MEQEGAISAPTKADRSTRTATSRQQSSAGFRPLDPFDQMTPPDQPYQLRGRTLATQVVVLGAVLSAVLVGLALLLVASDLHGYVVGGCLAGLAASGLGGLVFARAAVLAPGDPRNSLAFVRSLVFDFGLQFGAVVAGMLVLRALEMKFTGIAAFGVTFAAVALLVHVAGAVWINRALGQRARVRQS